MSAIATNLFRHINCDNFITSIGTNSLYSFIGRSSPWTDEQTPDTPIDGPYQHSRIWQSMLAMKKIGIADAIKVIPRYDWAINTAYVAWDDEDPDIFSKQFYVYTDEYKIYKCIIKGLTNSTIKPSHTTTNVVLLADGYAWLYMGTTKQTDREKFANSSFIPVKTIDADPGGSAWEDDQWDLQAAHKADKNGGIFKVEIINGGTGYSGTPTATIQGNGTNCSLANPTVTNGTITSINVNYTTDYSHGTLYNYANVVIGNPGGGTGLSARVVLSPPNGHGTDIEKELGAFYTEIYTEIVGSESEVFPIANYRQLGLILDPYNYGTTTPATATTRIACKTLILDNPPNPPLVQIPNSIITGNISGAKAYVVDYLDTGSVYRIRYIQYDLDPNINCIAFTTTDTITSNSGGGQATIKDGTGLLAPQVQPFSGTILQYENRTYVTRSSDSQTEKMHTIIQF